MIDSYYAIGVIIAMGLITFALRALPFIAAQWLKKHPIVQTLGEFLPLAIMTLLLLHSVTGSANSDHAGPWPEFIAIFIVVLLQWRVNNPLLSILAGTCVYVLIRNFHH